MATWIYERFDFIPYLQLIGPPGSGKTRSLEVLNAVCYHAAKHTSPTAAVLFRMVSKYQPTLLIDEVDSGMRGDLRDILREGTSRDGKVIRCSSDDYQPHAYPCFSPKIYAGQEPITDPALVSRIIQENMARVVKAQHIGPSLAPNFRTDARNLQARLLRWALESFWNIEELDPVWADPRQRQVFLPLFTVAPNEFHGDLRLLMERQANSARVTMQDSLDGEVVAALKRMGSQLIIRPLDVAREVCSARGIDYEDARGNPERVGPEKIGNALKRLGIVECTRSAGGMIYRVEANLLDRLYATYLPGEPPAETAERE
jgi:hypothetical protein